MNKAKSKVLEQVVKIANATTKVDKSGWPPPCIGFIYQPKRPKLNDEVEEQEK